MLIAKTLSPQLYSGGSKAKRRSGVFKQTGRKIIKGVDLR